MCISMNISMNFYQIFCFIYIALYYNFLEKLFLCIEEYEIFKLGTRKKQSEIEKI